MIHEKPEIASLSNAMAVANARYNIRPCWEHGRRRPHCERSSRWFRPSLASSSRFALIADEDVRAPSKAVSVS